MTKKDSKSLSLTSNAKLAQSDTYQIGSQEIPCSIPTGGNFFLLNLFCRSLHKPLLPMLPESSVLGETRLVSHERLQIGSWTSLLN